MSYAKLLAGLDEIDRATAKVRAEIRALQALPPPTVPAPPPKPQPAPAPAPAGPGGLSDPKAFFDYLRASDVLFPADEFDIGQVEGINAILDACAGKAPLGWAAYVLATPYLETGATFEADTVESLNYSVEALIKKFSRERISVADAQRLGRFNGHPAEQEAIANAIYGGAWGRANLGNTEPGDGWKFRGRSWPQCTGRRNYQKADDALGLGGALVENPDLIFRPDIAAAALYRGMSEGWYTGDSLNDYIGSIGTRGQFISGRSIINPGDRAEDVAVAALEFQAGLQAGSWA